MAPAPRDIVYFDLETQRSAGDVGGFGNRDRMGMSVGVTFSTRTGEYRIFRAQEAEDLVSQLMRADLVVGYNHLHFDYGVLQAYTLFTLSEHTVNLDLMVDLEKRLGFRPKLEAVAKPTLGAGKTTDGLQAIVWFREGKWREIAEYCAYDVKVTLRVHEFGRRHGFVRYLDAADREQKVQVDW
jgi:DEAD/DEAH box helicase domain-containing protein